MATIFLASFKTFHSIPLDFFAYHSAHFPKEINTWKNMKYGNLPAISADLNDSLCFKMLNWTIDLRIRSSDVDNLKTLPLHRPGETWIIVNKGGFKASKTP